jgi:hypothetical protein
VLLLAILTFITVVLIMTGAIIPVLMYCAAIAAVLYVLLLIKRLFFDIFWPEKGETSSHEPDSDGLTPGDSNEPEYVMPPSGESLGRDKVHREDDSNNSGN